MMEESKSIGQISQFSSVYSITPALATSSKVIAPQNFSREDLLPKYRRVYLERKAEIDRNQDVKSKLVKMREDKLTEVKEHLARRLRSACPKRHLTLPPKMKEFPKGSGAYSIRNNSEVFAVCESVHLEREKRIENWRDPLARNLMKTVEQLPVTFNASIPKSQAQSRKRTSSFKEQFHIIEPAKVNVLSEANITPGSALLKKGDCSVAFTKSPLFGRPSVWVEGRDDMDIGNLTEEEESICKVLHNGYARLTFPLSSDVRHLLESDSSLASEWMKSRIDVSCRSCRFELPMDMKKLERMTIKEYLLHYCKISRHRQRAYTKMFDKYKNKYTGILPYKDLSEILQQIVHGMVEAKDFNFILHVLSVTPKSEIDLPWFQAICALTERILYCSTMAHICRIDGYREYLECSDFQGLKWKLEGVNIDGLFKRLLESIS